MIRTKILEMTDGVRVVAPDSLNLITPYILFEQQDWFEDEIVFLRRALQPGQQAIDVGANYGVYTLSIANAVGPTGAVWAFEPTSSTAELLAQAIVVNNYKQVVLERSALSSECGTAELALNDYSEHNALVRSERSTPASETVRLVTLDDCLERFGWNQIDFLKIDAEGEEANIIRGGSRFFTELSPLILYEVKAGAELHLDLVSDLAALGFDSYRLVPGLDLLIPFDSTAAPDGYMLNLFCCKKDCAASLAQKGLLIEGSSIDAFKASGRFNEFLATCRDKYRWQRTWGKLPYGEACAHLWEAAPRASPELNGALSCYAISQDADLDPLMRFSALETSFQALMSLCRTEAKNLRLASLARVARDYGARSLAVGALRHLADAFAKDMLADPGEPFLPPGSRFDAVAPRPGDLQSWIVSAVLEELERLNAFSSFFTGDAARGRLEKIASLGYASDEMTRRLLLIRMRFPGLG
jgi:FkbM family methyltransferase